LTRALRLGPLARTGRREFITGLGGAAAWRFAAHAQQGGRIRRIGVLMPFDENDPESKRRYSAFTRALADLGWTDGRNVRMDLRWAGADTNRIRALAQELVGLQVEAKETSYTGCTCNSAWMDRRKWWCRGIHCNPFTIPAFCSGASMQSRAKSSTPTMPS
jgi:hypothetical protein